MKKKFLTLTIICLTITPVSFGALNAYLRITGQTQGQIEGSVTQAGREGSIMVIGFAHEVVSPRDAASGLPTGKRQHAPVKITKEIDKSSPLLMNAWANQETLINFELRFWQPTASGIEEQFYTIILHDAKIVSIRQEMLNNKYPENMQHKEREHIAFTYRNIEWIYEDGGIQSSDDWSYSAADILLSDLSGDGFVNLIDLLIMANDWLKQTNP